MDFFLYYRNLFVGEEPWVEDAINEEIQREISENELELTQSDSPPSGSNRLPPRQLTNIKPSIKSEQSSNNQSNLTQKKQFDLQEVEIWIILASILGAILALVAFQLCKLCKIRIFAKKYPDICHIESQKVFDQVIQDGLDTVTKTKKVVVVNVHLVPCSHKPTSKSSPNHQIRVNKIPETELTPNGAIMLQAKTCRQNLTSTKHYNDNYIV